MYLLFPGRHIVNTRFQQEYLDRRLGIPISEWPDLMGDQSSTFGDARIREVIYAVTSCNKSNSRYNPLPFELRSISIYEFARQWKRSVGVDFRIAGIPHYQPTARYAELLLKEVQEQSDGDEPLTPANTVVLTSTPSVMQAYRELGYSILPAEYDPVTQHYKATVPTDIVHRIGAGDPLADLPISTATRQVFEDIPEAVNRIVRLYNDPILTEQGDLTETRNYNTYTESMTNVMEIKYRDIKDFIVPGKIIDEGCADGTLIRRIVPDFPDSDIIGVDLSAEMLARANELKREGVFGNAFVFFKQQNLTTPVSDGQASSVDTIICNSTLHELWSYGHRADTVREYLHGKAKQLRRHGRLVVRDVVGPENGDMAIDLWCSDTDGENPVDIFGSPAAEQSTRSRFFKFVHDFSPRPISHADQSDGTFRTTLRNAMEFISKMEYTDNWASEMHEEFCFWSLTDWLRELNEAGLSPHPSSHAYVNTWRVEHRFAGHVRLADVDGIALAFPVTNMVLVGEKP